MSDKAQELVQRIIETAQAARAARPDDPESFPTLAVVLARVRKACES